MIINGFPKDPPNETLERQFIAEWQKADDATRQKAMDYLRAVTSAKRPVVARIVVPTLIPPTGQAEATALVADLPLLVRCRPGEASAMRTEQHFKIKVGAFRVRTANAMNKSTAAKAIAGTWS
jgi:hypothetical protein